MMSDCHKARALRLLPYAIRENLPILGSQQSLAGRAKALAKWATIDGSRAWYISEASARRNPEGRAVDYLLYGLVVGQGQQLDYFWLSDFVTGRGPVGRLVERDSRWRPKTLGEIAPEMFETRETELED
ncbi:MAG: hypothetical protein ABFE13_10985 [Phycisphaerales bacterium]